MMKKNEYKPEILNEKEAKRLMKLKYINLVDAFSRQLKELFVIDNPIYSGEKKEEGYQTKKFQEFCKQNENNFIYIYYPWNHTVVKTVKKDKYLKLKTNRNQDLI